MAAEQAPLSPILRIGVVAAHYIGGALPGKKPFSFQAKKELELILLDYNTRYGYVFPIHHKKK